MTDFQFNDVHRRALDMAIGRVLTNEERAALVELRDACPKPPWYPTEDGLAVYVDSQGRRVYYVRGGKVARILRPDGTLSYPQDPFEFGTWEPCPEVTR